MTNAETTLAETQLLRARIERGDVVIGLLPPNAVDAMLAGYEGAGEAGAAVAWRELAQCHAEGIGVPRDLAAAVRAWERAARMDDRPSALALVHTRALLQGEGPEEARRIIEGLLPDDTDGEAHLLAGYLVYRGFGYDKDDAKSLALHRRGAELGNAAAMMEVAIMLATGQGANTDEAESLAFLQRAAELDHPRACYNLGANYATGRGVPQDWSECVKWYRKAAHAGNGRAAAALALMYRVGDGVDADEAEAEKWAEVAAELGYPV